MSHWHELDGNMRAADDYYEVCGTCWGDKELTEYEPEWECPDCGAMWYLEEDEE